MIVVEVGYTAHEVDHFARILAREFEDGGCDVRSKTYALLSALVGACPAHVPGYVVAMVERERQAASAQIPFLAVR